MLWSIKHFLSLRNLGDKREWQCPCGGHAIPLARAMPWTWVTSLACLTNLSLYTFLSPPFGSNLTRSFELARTTLTMIPIVKSRPPEWSIRESLKILLVQYTIETGTEHKKCIQFTATCRIALNLFHGLSFIHSGSADDSFDPLTTYLITFPWICDADAPRQVDRHIPLTHFI